MRRSLMVLIGGLLFFSGAAAALSSLPLALMGSVSPWGGVFLLFIGVYTACKGDRLLMSGTRRNR